MQATTGWQIDAFGHSAINAYLFAEMGYDAMIFARVSDDLKVSLRGSQDMEFNWSPTHSLDESNRV